MGKAVIITIAFIVAGLIGFAVFVIQLNGRSAADNEKEVAAGRM
jgi:hypothetical protein